MKRIGLVILALWVGMISAYAHARKPKPAVEVPQDYVNQDLPDDANVWHCWYDGTVSVLCRIGETLTGDADASSSDADVDPRLPQIVSRIWRHATEMAGRIVAIPMHATPYDMASTGQLAESVMCGGSKVPCGIIFAANAALLSALVDKRRTLLVARRLNLLALNN